jgi:hypothetical protein
MCLPALISFYTKQYGADAQFSIVRQPLENCNVNAVCRKKEIF